MLPLDLLSWQTKLKGPPSVHQGSEVTVLLSSALFVGNLTFLQQIANKG